MPMYPTKEEIMTKEQRFKPEVLTLIRGWKKEIWKNYKGSDETKQQALNILVNKITDIYGKPVDIEFAAGNPAGHYSARQHKIYLIGTPSIITVLHELAHHLFGPSELKACRWSVWLFKRTFPKAFQKLRWQGHMLKRL
jgi:hypothetical protein